MTLVEQNFGCNVLWSTANGVGALGHDLGESIVDELQVAIVTDHDILRLEVAIADVTRVKILENARDLGAIEGRVLGVKVAHCTMISEQITSAEQLRCEINVTIVLEKAIITELWAVRKTEAGEMLNYMQYTGVDLRRKDGPSWRGCSSRFRCDPRACSE